MWGTEIIGITTRSNIGLAFESTANLEPNETIISLELDDSSLVCVFKDALIQNENQRKIGVVTFTHPRRGDILLDASVEEEEFGLFSLDLSKRIKNLRVVGKYSEIKSQQETEQQTKHFLEPV